MPDAYHAEFTGERVIPGRVEDNLFNEHLARYRFTAHLARELGLTGAFLDAGCGAGYGSAELARIGGDVLGIDISEEAITHARANYQDPHLRFEFASCTTVPAADGAFRLIAAFEVIEHLSDWREFLTEVRRVLDPAGVFLVSTPNQLYYAESRQKAGPNPFHVHEFTEEEFRSELRLVFPHVKILLQNHVEGVAFSGADAETTAAVEIGASREHANDPASAHFFLAICAQQPLPPVSRFVFIPDSGNVLQTRERHIALLEGEIRQKNEWIEAEKSARARMMEKVGEMEAELELHNRWAQQANQEAERRAQLVAELQQELRKSNEWAQSRDAEAVERGQRIIELQEEVAKATTWAQERNREAGERSERITALQEEVAKATEWARSQDAEATERGRRIEQLQEEVAQASAWANARDREAEERGQRVLELQEELEEATKWAKDRDAEAETRGQRILALQDELEREEAQLSAARALVDQWQREKAESDSRLDDALKRLEALTARMNMIADSRWVRLGRTIRIGPEIERT